MHEVLPVLLPGFEKSIHKESGKTSGRLTDDIFPELHINKQK
jgi:hypothetical protein